MNYCIDPNVAEPIMLLNKQIGQSFNPDGSWDGVPFIDGAEFQQELLSLDNAGKKRIQVWINSEGGSVMQGMNIFNAILKTKTPCDTYNVGVAASIASAIFMAGRKRIMSDYALFMVHPVSGGDNKSLKAFNDSIATMLSAKCSMTEDQMSAYMANTTWLCAEDCMKMNICTEIEDTGSSNTKFLPTQSVDAMNYGSTIINKFVHNKNSNNKMIKVTNRLNLNADANEDSIVGAIDALQTEKNNAEKALADANNKLKEVQNQLDILQEEKNLLDKQKKDAEDAAAEVAAKDLVNKHVNKIGTENVDKFVQLAKNDLEGTKTMLEKLPLNVVSNRMNQNSGGDGDGTIKGASSGTYAAQIMLEIQNKTQKK